MSYKLNRALVVDDHENWREVIKELLQEIQCEIIERTNIQDALEVLKKEKIDLLISDIRFGDKEIFNLDGIKLANWVKYNLPEAKIVLLTGYIGSIRKEVNETFLILEKPFNSETFKRKINELLVDDF